MGLGFGGMRGSEGRGEGGLEAAGRFGKGVGGAVARVALRGGGSRECRGALGTGHGGPGWPWGGQ